MTSSASRRAAAVRRVGTLAVAGLAFALLGPPALRLPARATEGGASARAARRPELRVSAATSLKAAFEEIEPAFEQASGVDVVFNFEASGLLQRQIEAGAPADAFASASPSQVRALTDAGLVRARSAEPFARNDVVLFVPRDNPAGIRSTRDLGRAHRLSTGDPRVAPHGAKAVEWLTAIGQWPDLQPRFVLAHNAAQTFDYVARGEVDAGIGFASEIVRADAVRIVAAASQDGVAPATCVIAPLIDARHPAAAGRFADYLLSSAGQEVMSAHGFLPVR